MIWTGFKNIVGPFISPYLAVGLLAALLGLYGWHWWAVSSAFREGKAAAVEAIEKANRASNAKADKAQLTVDQCHAKGGTWNREAGKCAL